MYSWESSKYWITCRVIMSGEILMCCIAQLLCWLTTGETTPPINFKHNSKRCWAIVFRYLIKFDKTSLRKDQHREEKLISFIDNFFFLNNIKLFSTTDRGFSVRFVQSKPKIIVSTNIKMFEFSFGNESLAGWRWTAP